MKSWICISTLTCNYFLVLHHIYHQNKDKDKHVFSVDPRQTHMLSLLWVYFLGGHTSQCPGFTYSSVVKGHSLGGPYEILGIHPWLCKENTLPVILIWSLIAIFLVILCHAQLGVNSYWIHFFLFFFSVWVTPDSSQGLYLALHSKITPGRLRGTHEMPGFK